MTKSIVHISRNILLLFMMVPCSFLLAKRPVILYDSLRIEGQLIIVSLHIDDMFDEQIIQGLRKGMTAAVEYRVQIWHDKRRWVKSIILERYKRIKINFDQWEKKFRVTYKGDENRLFEESDLIQYCRELKDFTIGDADLLSKDEHYRVMTLVRISPMSVENITELKHWLSGEAENLDTDDLRVSKSPIKKTGDWLLRIMIDLTGFGDRMITGKSPAFYFINGQLLFEETL